ncbi:MAG: GGDEF domain-containing protein [Lachnospiraceae bacterium]
MISMDALMQREDGFRIGSMKNVTQERRREEIWQNQAQRDSLTGLYNNQTGKILISEYLAKKSPFSSCGMMVIDIDFFKNINDNYGHLFGDEVLTKFAAFLRTFFAEKDIFVRAGGDEFVVLLKEISHQNLLKKSMQFVQLVRKIRFFAAECLHQLQRRGLFFAGKCSRIYL